MSEMDPVESDAIAEAMTSSNIGQFQQVKSESGIPSIIYNVPVGAILDGRTSIQVVSNSLPVPHAVTNNSSTSNMIVIPDASDAVKSNPTVDEITANVLHQQTRRDGDKSMKNIGLPLKLDMSVPSVSGSSQTVEGSGSPQQFVTIRCTSPNEQGEGGQQNRSPAVTISTVPVMSRDIKGGLKATMTTLLGPSIPKDSILYPVDLEKLSQMEKLPRTMIMSEDGSRIFVPPDMQQIQLHDAVESIVDVASVEVSSSPKYTEIIVEEEDEDGHELDSSQENHQHMSDSMISESILQEALVAAQESGHGIHAVQAVIENASGSTYPGKSILGVVKKFKKRLQSRAPGGSRMRLRPWLEKLLDEESIDGLNWVDRDEKIFRVPWKHASEGSWHAEDSVIFRHYAIHSGRYPDDGPTTPKLHTRWKANFRCALNSLSDIVLLREISNPRGQKAYRIYKFLDSKSAKEEKEYYNRKGVSMKKPISHLPSRAWGGDLKNFTSQDAGELLIALKHSNRKGKLPPEFNMEGTNVIRPDSDPDETEEVIIVESRDENDESKRIDDYGDNPDTIVVSKEVEVGTESNNEADPTDFTDLVKHAMIAIGSSQADELNMEKDASDDEMELSIEENIPQPAVDVIKAEIYFMTQLPESMSPAALKLAIESTDSYNEFNSEDCLWKTKANFMFKFESPTGAELWTALLWCVACGQCFPSLSNLRRHLAIHQEKRSWIDEQMTLVSTTSTTNSSDCLVCGLKCSKASAMMKHLLQHSGNFSVGSSSGFKKCPPCVVCGKHFLNVDKLTNHMSSHVCPVCYITTYDMEKHVSKAHSTAGLYQCYICHQYCKTHKAMLHHQDAAHSGVYAVDMLYTVKQPWITYCTQCYQLVRVRSDIEDVAEEENDKKIEKGQKKIHRQSCRM